MSLKNPITLVSPENGGKIGGRESAENGALFGPVKKKYLYTHQNDDFRPKNVIFGRFCGKVATPKNRPFLRKKMKKNMKNRLFTIRATADFFRKNDFLKIRVDF